jgi:hypothetical protein
MAQELLDKYNVEFIEEAVCKEFDLPLESIPPHWNVCVVQFSKIFDVKVIRTHVGYKFIGLQYDCAICMTMFITFMQAAETEAMSLGFKYKKKGEFVINATLALTRRMGEERSHHARGMIVRKDLLIAEHTKNWGLRKLKSVRTATSGSAAEAGRRYGETYRQKGINA